MDGALRKPLDRPGSHEVALDEIIGCDRRSKCERPSYKQDRKWIKLQIASHNEEDWPMPDIEAVADAAAEYRNRVLIDSMHEVALRLQDRRDHHCTWDCSE